jgi:CBS domain-containing protein
MTVPRRLIVQRTVNICADQCNARIIYAEDARVGDPPCNPGSIRLPWPRSRAMNTVAAILKHKGHQVTAVEPTATIVHVVDVLAGLRIGAVLVIDRADQILGIVSERDIMCAIAANGPRTLEMTAEQVMTRSLQTAHPATTVTEAMTMMTIGRSRHLPVMDHDVLVGLISIGDVVKARIMEQESDVASLKTYVAGTG